MPTYIVTIKGKVRVPTHLWTTSIEYNPETDLTTIPVVAPNKDQATRTGAKMGQVVGVAKKVSTSK